MFDTHARKAGLGCCWLLLAGLAMPAAAAAPGAADWRLTVDLGVLADSNITGSTDDETIPLYQDGIALPVPLDPALRARGDIAFSVAASAGVRVPIDEALVLVVDAEVYALDHEGATNDDLSLLAAVGPEIGWEGGEASLQLIGFQRSYGGTSVAEGYGLRARYSDEVGSGQRLLLALDLRVFRVRLWQGLRWCTGGRLPHLPERACARPQRLDRGFRAAGLVRGRCLFKP
jgi:hypothetical protein